MRDKIHARKEKRVLIHLQRTSAPFLISNYCDYSIFRLHHENVFQYVSCTRRYLKDVFQGLRQRHLLFRGNRDFFLTDRVNFTARRSVPLFLIV